MHANDSPTTAATQPLTSWGRLPKSARLLYVTAAGEAADWLRELLAADNSMSVEVEQALGAHAGLTRLRKESFDAVLVHHLPGELDAVTFIEAHRASGADDAVLICGDQSEQQLAPLAYEVGADGYLHIESAGPRQFIWLLARAIEWHRLVHENRRLAQSERQRLRLEHGEAERLLAQQRGLIHDLEEVAHRNPIPTDSGNDSGRSNSVDQNPIEVPGSLVGHYIDLLKAHVIMGSGNLSRETAAVVDSLENLNLPVPRVMQLHLHAVEATLRGLGNRSSRHVMSRADLLVLEIMTQLAERYRKMAVRTDMDTMSGRQ